MRLIVIGSPRQRRELREQIETSAPDVVGEFSSLAEAKDSSIDADAFILPAAASIPDFDGTPTVESLTHLIVLQQCDGAILHLSRPVFRALTPYLHRV